MLPSSEMRSTSWAWIGGSPQKENLESVRRGKEVRLILQRPQDNWVRMPHHSQKLHYLVAKAKVSVRYRLTYCRPRTRLACLRMRSNQLTKKRESQAGQQALWSWQIASKRRRLEHRSRRPETPSARGLSIEFDVPIHYFPAGNVCNLHFRHGLLHCWLQILAVQVAAIRSTIYWVLAWTVCKNYSVRYSTNMADVWIQNGFIICSVYCNIESQIFNTDQQLSGTSINSWKSVKAASKFQQ